MDEWIENIPKNNKIGDNQDDNKLSACCENDSHHIFKKIRYCSKF